MQVDFRNDGVVEGDECVTVEKSSNVSGWKSANSVEGGKVGNG